MAKSFRYDHPAYLVPRSVHGAVGATASGTYAHYASSQRFRLKGLLGVVLVAGTHDDNNALTIRNGTDSIGSVNPAKLAPLSTFSVTLPNAVFEPGELLNLVKGSDSTGQSVITYEIEVLPDAEFID